MLGRLESQTFRRLGYGQRREVADLQGVWASIATLNLKDANNLSPSNNRHAPGHE